MRIAPIVAVAVALVPPLLVARARVVKSRQPRIHLVPDMDNQPKVRTQQYNPLFADRRAMRRPPAGTVARGDLQEDDHLYRGRVANDWATTFPMPVTEAMMRRGQERFNIYCAPCHGLDGAGRGPVAARAEQIGGPWVPPLSYHQAQVRDRPHGHIFNTITNGIRTMPAYGPQIPAADRWAIVAYVRALQRSQDARLEDVPEEYREALSP
jgi:mono/diheme cytochrome c family protein